MGLSFIDSPSYLFTSESVTEGHPDKVCDQISDAILDAILAQDPMGRVACETAVTTGLVVVMGEVSTNCYVDIPLTVRETIRKIGYTDASYGIDCTNCGIIVSIKEQSSDISSAVSQSLETRHTSAVEDEIENLGAGDQGMMVGYACNETPQLMPMPISLAHALCQRLAIVRKEGILPYLRPDGKSQVTIEYSYGIPKRIHTAIVSAQHADEVSSEQLANDIVAHVMNQVLPGKLIDADTKFLVNPSGRFVNGGPNADTGLTGRKILVDTYGGSARHGGGAFSGKDPTKVDRSGAYAARYVAKNVVAAGLADRAEIQVSYAIGVSRPISVSVETFETGKVKDEIIQELIQKHFDLRAGAIITNMGLRRPIYKGVAAYGHFGREELAVPWEQTDKAAIMRAEANIS